MQKRKKVPCKLCGRKVFDDTESKAEHMVYVHPTVALQKAISSVPRLQQIGAMIGDIFRKAVQDGR